MDMFTMIMACSLYPDNAIVNAIIQVEAKENPLTVKVRTGENKGVHRNFKSAAEAAAFAKEQINLGNEVELGLLQIPNKALASYPQNVGLYRIFQSCKNVAVGSALLNQAAQRCAKDSGEQRQLCTLSVYKTGSMFDGVNYAQRIVNYAKVHRIQDNPQNKIAEDQGLKIEDLQLPVPNFGQVKDRDR